MTQGSSHLIITIDGPASSGKGTLARRLAEMFDLAYLDTGLLYRKVGLEAYRRGIDEQDAAAAEILARDIAAYLNWGDLADPDLRSPQAGRGASVFAAMPGVRAALVAIQRGFAHTPPLHMNGKPCHGVVLDGRDMGTVICPEAPVKFFVTADVEERARRRLADLQGKGFTASYDDVLADLKDRDDRDTNRAVAPLKPAPDAHRIDTTHADENSVVNQAAAAVEAWLQQGR